MPKARDEAKAGVRGKVSRGIVQSSLILALSIVLGASFNCFTPFGIPWSARQNLPVVMDSGDITLEEARYLHEMGTAVFVDARDQASFRAGHIAGALNITLESVPDNIEMLRAMTNSGMLIVIYCDGLECPLGGQLARELRRQGISAARVLSRGLSAWAAAKYPTIAGQ